MDIIAARTGWTPLGIVPWFADAWRLPAEDVMDIAGRRRHGARIKVAVPRLNRIANFDDLDPLSAEPDISVEIINAGAALPGDADLVLLPGSKSTIADLAHFRAQGWDIDLAAHVRRGGHVLGLCGGYQMLGQWIDDPQGLEGPPARVAGLGHLAVSTTMQPEKRLALTHAIYAPTGDPVAGYEIHLGQTDGPDCARGWLKVADQMQGAASANGRVRGCYLHGLFSADGFRAAYLRELGANGTTAAYGAGVEATLDALAAHLEQSLDIPAILRLAAEIPAYSNS